MPDAIDRFIDDWQETWPAMDVAGAAALLRVIHLGAELERELAGISARHGLKPSQFNVLAALRRQDRPLAPKALVEAAILTSGALTPVFDRLEAAGLIRRLPDPDDRRGVLLTLTAEGRRAIEAALEERMACHARRLAVLPPEAREQLAGLLRRVLAPEVARDEK